MAATDGHTCALARCDDAPAPPADAPPLAAVLACEGARVVAELHIDSLEAAAVLLRSLKSGVETQLYISDESVRVRAVTKVGSGRKKRLVVLFNGDVGEPYLNVRALTGCEVNIAPKYLIRAMKSLGTLVCKVWQQKDPLSPYFITYSSATDITTEDHIEIVMPCRR
jgi:hypothetical protein